MESSTIPERRNPLHGWLPPLIFLGAIAYYAALWARVGLNLNDGGFILALSHRILDGEVPYRDFIYVRPPVSVYLHTLPLLLGDHGLYADRLFTLVQFSVIALVGSKIMKDGIEGMGRECPEGLYWHLCTAGLVLGIHNSPMFGWYTIDGVLFSVLALWALSADRSVTAGILALCAALCKQNFAIALVLLSGLSLVRGSRHFMRFTSGVVCSGIVFAAYLWHVNAIRPFIQQVLAAGTVGDVIDSGLKKFVVGTVVDRYTLYCGSIAIAIVGVSWLFRHRNRGRAGVGAVGIDLYTTLMCATLIMFGSRVLRKSLQGDGYDYFIAIFHGSRLLFLTAAVGLAWAVRDRWRTGTRSFRELANRWGAFLGLFAIAWTSAISWGYPIPAVLSAPSLVPFVISGAPVRSIKKRLWSISILGTVAFGIALSHPYGESTRLDRMVAVPGRYHATAMLWASKETVAKLEEIARIDAEMGSRPYAVLPGFTPVTILFKRRCPSLLDWEINAEIPPGRRSEVCEHLSKVGAAVVVEKDVALRMIRGGRDNRWKSQPTQEVVDGWTCTAESEHFRVYDHRP